MEVTRVDEGLWRWVTGHPDWKPGDDRGREVGCVYWEADDATVLVDPLVPTATSERDRFLDALDRDVRRQGLPLVVLLTCAWHRRSADELAERYRGNVIEPAAREPLPGGAVAVRAPSADEVVFWLPPARSAVPGDVLLGTDDGLTLCPASWLEPRGGFAQLMDDLAPLLELPVERVLTSHGPPVLRGGGTALARALAGSG
jgi:glyoxylase-like metal-dependent hydrolase (beta-lactamase superfamily II)